MSSAPRRRPSRSLASFPPAIQPPADEHGVYVFASIAKIEGSLGRIEGKLDGVQVQLSTVERNLGAIERDTVGHGRWIHTLQAFAAGVAALIAWVFVNALWPWLKGRIGVPGR